MKAGLIILLLVLVPMGVFATVPTQVNYQGYLARPDGTPLDTTVTMTFTLYTDSINPYQPRWTEIRPSVQVTHGLFNDRLGQLTALTDTVMNLSPLWLGVTVGTDAETAPRTRLVSVGYSLRVATIDGSNGGAVNGDVAISGKVTIGQSMINTGARAFAVGFLNTASGDNSTVCGGTNNSATDEGAAIVGGLNNQASANSAFTGGGQSNSASGPMSFVGGGSHNMASGDHSYIGGGDVNRATGVRSGGCRRRWMAGRFQSGVRMVLVCGWRIAQHGGWRHRGSLWRHSQ